MLVMRFPALPSFGELPRLDGGDCSAEVVCLLTDLVIDIVASDQLFSNVGFIEKFSPARIHQMLMGKHVLTNRSPSVVCVCVGGGGAW